MRMAQAAQWSRKKRIAMYLSTACWPARIVFRAAMRAMMRGCLKTRKSLRRRTHLSIFKKPALPPPIALYGSTLRKSSQNQLLK